MRDAYEKLVDAVLAERYQAPPISGEDLRTLISEFAAFQARRNPPGVTDEEIEQCAKTIEANEGISAEFGAIVSANDDFEPWLEAAKADIDTYYWDRYRRLLQKQNFPKNALHTTDEDTDKILGRLGNPNQSARWDRRGLVVGHVQSGKTANYTGLICKAADAGYRFIIVVAGLHNNLRKQTQERIDEGFIGRDTGGIQKTGRNIIGVGQWDTRNTPVCLTNTLRDFNKQTASTNTSDLNSYAVPLVIVIKKRTNILSHLLQWLEDNSIKDNGEMIDQPMLLIDDEADNASINTKYNKSSITETNRLIRKILEIFHRSSYVGYTATPFANIFIDPDDTDEMVAEDLFPRDFIYGLEAPSNYFGSQKIFLKNNEDDQWSEWIRIIDDNEDIIPVSHRADLILTEIPQSLKLAIRTFIISSAMRLLRGQEHKHMSMLVNASWRQAIQAQIKHRIKDFLEPIINAVKIHSHAGQNSLRQEEIFQLKNCYDTQFIDNEFSWEEIQTALLQVTSSIELSVLNSSSKDTLDYHSEKVGRRGKTYIAIGGYSLSRGLTLEGLTTTWFLRNTKMYDTLMQMGRWFGYREGYQDLCRIWMSVEALDWYEFIADATQDLHSQLRDMELANKTPKDFGLAVRSHPASLLVTARNKMGNSEKHHTQIGFSEKFLEAARVSAEPHVLQGHRALARSFVSKIDDIDLVFEHTGIGHVVKNVPAALIEEFLLQWKNAPESPRTVVDPILAYIRHLKASELASWDVLIPSAQNKGDVNNDLGIPIRPRSRSINLADFAKGIITFGGSKARIGDPNFEKAGLAPDQVRQIEKDYREQREMQPDEPVNSGKIFRRKRTNALFILYFYNVFAPTNDHDDSNDHAALPASPVVSWGISFPKSLNNLGTVEVVVNAAWFKEHFGEDDQDEENE